jgi:hypothetical protein
MQYLLSFSRLMQAYSQNSGPLNPIGGTEYPKLPTYSTLVRLEVLTAVMMMMIIIIMMFCSGLQP